MSKLKRCECCEGIITKLKRNKYHKIKNWDGMKWRKPSPMGKPDNKLSYLTADGTPMRESEPQFNLCKNCIDFFKLLDLEYDPISMNVILPNEIKKMRDTKISKTNRVSEEELDELRAIKPAY